MYVCIVIGHTPALEQHRVAESLGSWANRGGVRVRLGCFLHRSLCTKVAQLKIVISTPSCLPVPERHDSRLGDHLFQNIVNGGLEFTGLGLGSLGLKII